MELKIYCKDCWKEIWAGFEETESVILLYDFIVLISNYEIRMLKTFKIGVGVPRLNGARR